MKISRTNLLSVVEGVAHGFFGRTGGVSQGIYGSLNCGLGSSDSPSLVRENRSRVASVLGTKETSLITAYQIHSARAVQVTQAWMREEAPQADGMATNVAGIALGVLAADCVPVLFSDTKAHVIGCAHAGWRGALGGVLESVVSTMEELGAHKSRIVASVGPAISQSCYEVGPEFYENFCKADCSNSHYFDRANRDGHWLFDLPMYVQSRLKRLELQAFDVVPACTYENEADYFSYRRATHWGEPDYGRNISAIMLVTR